MKTTAHNAFSIAKSLLLMLTFLAAITSCSENDSTWDPYHDWQSRNQAWYLQIADSARTAIAQAKAQYGDQWQQNCQWRMFKSLYKAQDFNSGLLTDSICVHIIQSGAHAGDTSYMPAYNDSVRLCYRGWLMPTEYENTDGSRYNYQTVFAQTFYGPYRRETAAPSLMSVTDGIEGFGTALQYMTPADEVTDAPGDTWLVYLPQQLAYGAKSSDAIPAYSTLVFQITLERVYRIGQKVPTWKAPRK